MPRRPKTVSALADLMGRLGRPSSERLAVNGDAVARRHTGWRWLCGCSAFARGADDYLWIACPEHDPSRAPRLARTNVVR